MSTLTLASDPKDAAAVEAVEAHHAQLAGELAGRVAMLVAAADRDPAEAEEVRTGLVAFCDRDLLPHAVAEESTLYAAARDLPEARLLIDGMLAEHRRLAALVDALRGTGSAVRAAAADGRALQVLFEEHLDKENDLVLPLLAGAPDISLADLLGGMHELLGGGEEAGARASRRAAAAAGRAAAVARTTPTCPNSTYGRCRTRCVTRRSSARWAPCPAGRAMLLVAPHDPLPLLRQIEERHPGVFSVEYQQRGPEAWRLLLTHR